VRDHSGQPFSFLRAFTCYLIACFGSDADVSPVIGGRAPRLPFCACFGSDADVIPSSGCQAPCLPSVCAFCVVWRA
jgi:hypothetical protein